MEIQFRLLLNGGPDRATPIGFSYFPSASDVSFLFLLCTCQLEQLNSAASTIIK